MCEARGEFVVLSFERSDTLRTFVKGEFVSSKPKAHRVKEEREFRIRKIYKVLLYYFTCGVIMIQKKESKEDDRISFIGNRDIWQDFVYKVKKNKKKVWQELEPILENYIKSN